MDGWTFFTLEVNNFDKYLFYKCYNTLESIELKEELAIGKFLPKLQL